MRSARPEAIFIDRDGVLNELVWYDSSQEFESPRTPADLRIRPGVIEALTVLRKAGPRLFLVSNQPSYAKGKTPLEALLAVHAALEATLAGHGLRFDEAFYCYHHPQGIVPELTGPCECRKPKPYFLRQAAGAYGLELAACWMVGDQGTDLECGQAAGCRTAWIPNALSAHKRGTAVPDVTCVDLLEFANLIVTDALPEREPLP